MFVDPASPLNPSSSSNVHYVHKVFFWYRYRNQNVAVKILHKGDSPEEASKKEASFMREVNMLSRVQHKNLVKVRLAS